MSSAPCCCLCSAQDAAFLCTCKPPVVPICENCFHPAHDSHIFYPIRIDRPAAIQPESMQIDETSNVSCEICQGPASLICLCKAPIQGFCQTHLVGHKAKFPQADHYQVSAVHLGRIPVENLDAVKAKHRLIDETLRRLQNVRMELGQKKTVMEQKFEELFDHLTTVKTEEMEVLDEKTALIDTKIAEFERASVELRFNSDYAPQTKLEFLVACESSAELARTNLEMLRVEYPQFIEAKQAIDKLVQISTNMRLFDAAPVIERDEEAKEASVSDFIFPYVSSTRFILLTLPKCDAYRAKSFPARHRPQLDDCSQIVLLPQKTVFCVGGRESNYVCTISVTAFVTELPKMANKRGCAGVVLVGPYVHVFGGAYNSQDLCACERYNIETKLWVPMQGELKWGRSRFSPCAHKRKIYLLGGGPAKGEYYSEEYDSCYGLPFNMPSNGPAIAFETRDNRLVFISGNEMYKVIDNRIEPLRKRCDFEACSHIAPVKINNWLYFSDWNTDFKVIRVDLNSLKWEETANYARGIL